MVMEAVDGYYADGFLSPPSASASQIRFSSVYSEAAPTTGESPTHGAPSHDPFDDECLDGRMTLCVHLTGDQPEMHRKCLGMLLLGTQSQRRQIRVVCSGVSNSTLEFLSALEGSSNVDSYLAAEAGVSKWEALQLLLEDSSNPITDRWLAWFDTTARPGPDPQWYPKLASAICHHQKAAVRLLGQLAVQPYTLQQMAWIKERPWYRGRPFQLANGVEDPKGTHIQHVQGDFFAAEVKALREVGGPDIDAGELTGPILAEQLHQAGYKIRSWNQYQQFVSTVAT